MNTFTDSVKSELTEHTVASLVGEFLAGRNAKSKAYSSVDRALYSGNKIIARLSPDGSILLPKSSYSDVELNDQMVGQIYHQGKNFRRITNFDDLSSPIARVNDIDSRNFDDFRAVAKLFNFPFDDIDLKAVERAKEFRERVRTFFKKIQDEEQERIRTEEERSRAARVAKEAISWDTGKGSATNSNVEGSGGGQRLRRKIKASGDRYDKVETSTGHQLTLNQAKKSWEFATKCWHGGQQLYGSSRRKTISSGGYYGRSRSAVVTETHLKFGCQTVTRQEAERFADAMGWARAKA